MARIASWLDRLLDDPGSWLLWVSGASLLMLVGTLVVVPVVVARIPADHFVTPPARSTRRLAWRVLLNLLGALVIVCGILMLVLPGQGLLTLLAGLLMVEFPAKRRLEVWILRRAPVQRVVQWMRERAGEPPLELPPEDSEQRTEESHRP